MGSQSQNERKASKIKSPANSSQRFTFLVLFTTLMKSQIQIKSIIIPALSNSYADLKGEFIVDLFLTSLYKLFTKQFQCSMEYSFFSDIQGGSNKEDLIAKELKPFKRIH